MKEASALVGAAFRAFACRARQRRPPTMDERTKERFFIFSLFIVCSVWASSLAQHVRHNEPKLHPFSNERNNRFLFHSILCAIWFGNYMSASSLAIVVVGGAAVAVAIAIHISPFNLVWCWWRCSGDANPGPLYGRTVSCERTSVRSRRVERREKYSIIQLITITNNCTIFHLHSHSTHSPRSIARTRPRPHRCPGALDFGFFDVSTYSLYGVEHFDFDPLADGSWLRNCCYIIINSSSSSVPNAFMWCECNVYAESMARVGNNLICDRHFCNFGTSWLRAKRPLNGCCNAHIT